MKPINSLCGRNERFMELKLKFPLPAEGLVQRLEQFL
jgi:hypothetical protein